MSFAQLPPLAQQRGPVRVRVTPPDQVLANSATQQYNAFVGFFTGAGKPGGERNQTAVAGWSIADTTKATINAGTGLATADAANTGGTFVNMTPGPFTTSVPLQVSTVGNSAVTSVAVTPASPSIPLGRGLPLKATATYFDTSMHDVTQTAAWSSNLQGVATVDTQGGVKSVGQGGPATITAMFGGQNGTSSVTVSAPVLASREIVPFRPTVDLGSSQQIQLLDTESDASVTDQTANAAWLSSDATIAAISNANGRQGFITGAKKGSVVISATYQGTLNMPATVKVPKPRFAYGVNTGNKTISIFAVNAADGTLSNIGYQPLGSTPGPLTIEPKGRYLYVPLASGAINGYVMNISTGFLTPVPGSPFAVNALPKPLVADPTGRFVYATTISGFQGFQINQGTGSLAAAGSVAMMSSTNPNSLTLDPSAKFAYVVHGSNNMCGMSPCPDVVDGYNLDPTTGAATSAGPPFNVTNGTGSKALSISASGKFAYMTNLLTGYLSLFTINGANGQLSSNGTVSPPSAHGISTEAVASGPADVTVDPTGLFLFVANGGSNNVSAFTVDQSTGQLTTVGTFGAGTTPSGVTVDPQAQFLYVTNSGSSDVSAYNINPSSGSLTLNSTIATQDGATGLTILHGDPPTFGSNFLYIGNVFSDSISAFALNTSTGLLTPIPGSPFLTMGLNHIGTCTTGGSQTCDTGSPAVGVDNTVKFAYYLNRFSNTISIFNIGTNGALSQAPISPVHTDPDVPRGAIPDPAGSYGFFSLDDPTLGQGIINVFTQDPQTGLGTPSSGNPFIFGRTGGEVLAVSGDFLYVGVDSNMGPLGFIYGFHLNRSTGFLTPIPGAPFPVPLGKPKDMRVTPNGKFLYAVASQNQPSTSGVLSGYTVDTVTGALNQVQQGTVALGPFEPDSVAIDSSGRFLYVGNTTRGPSGDGDGPGQIVQFNLDETTGAVTQPIAVTTTGHMTLGIEPTGRYLYAVEGFLTGNGTDKVLVFAVNPATGALTQLGSFNTGGNGSASATITRSLN